MFTLPFFLLASLLTTVAGAVSVKIPLVQQLPQIARVAQPFTWSFAQGSFASNKGPITYTVPSSIPKWLSFDAESLTFRGTPGPNDEGYPSITVTAHDASSSVSSHFTLCVTNSPPPELHIPIQDQFRPNNPSLSSVSLMDDHSALKSGIPALRVPPGWSFSVGLDGDTYTSPNELYYDARSADGSPLPNWLVFRSWSMTFNGVAPYIKGTRVFSIALHVSDQEGYTAAVAPFNLVVSSEEVLVSSSGPNTAALSPINVTAESAYSISLTSTVLTGVLIDGRPINPSEVKELKVDTSAYATWLKYDPQSRILSGTPPSQIAPADISVPVTIVTNSQQSVETSLPIKIGPSFFNTSTIPAIMSDDEGNVKFDLSKFFSNLPRNDFDLSASFNVTGTGHYLHFDSRKAVLEGHVPASFAQDIAVTFAAYSHISRSTSHARADLHFPESRVYVPGGPSGELSEEAAKSKKHRAMIIALAVTFALVGGIGFFVLLAMLRRCMRTSDSALVGPEAFDKLPDVDKQWYLQQDGPQARGGFDAERGGQSPGTVHRTSMYGNLGLGRPFSPPTRAPLTGDGSFMNKSAFVSKIQDNGVLVTRIQEIKAGIRRVSDRYRKRPGRPIISKPSPAPTHGADFPDGMPFYGDTQRSLDQTSYASSMPFSQETSTAMASSPTSSTGVSYPQRRTDYAPKLPTKPPQLRKQPSSKASMVSRGGGEQDEFDEDEFDEGVVMRATKEPSLRSARGSLSPSRYPHPEIKVTSASPGRSAIPTRQHSTKQQSPLGPGPRSKTPSPPSASSSTPPGIEYPSSPSGLTPQPSMPPPSLRPRVMPFTHAHHKQVDHGRKERVVSQSAHRVYTPLIAGEGDPTPALVSNFRTIHANVSPGSRFHRTFSTNEPPNSLLTVRLAGNGNGKLPQFMFQHNGRHAGRHAGFVEFDGDVRGEDRGRYTVDVVTLTEGVVVARVELVVE